MTDDESMRVLLWQWLQAALEVLKNESVPARLIWKPMETIGDTEGWQGEWVPDTLRWVYGATSRLIVLPDTGSVLAAIKNRPAFNEAFLQGEVDVSSHDQEINAVFDRCLAPLAVEAFRPTDPPRSIEQRFAELYNFLDEFINRYEGSEFLWVIHLSNISTEVDTVDLSPTVHIRKAVLEDKLRGFNASDLAAAGSPWDHKEAARRLQPTFESDMVPKVVVEVLAHHKMPRFRDNPYEMRELAIRVVEGLRLSGTGSVGGHSIWRIDPNPFNNYNDYQSAVRIESAPSWLLPGDQYRLTAARAELLKEIWPHITPQQGDGSLPIARRRFDDSYRRSSPADQQLDYWIGLEAMFLAKITDELSFRAALRIAKYLGGTAAERRELFLRARESYKLRSKLAHGEQPIWTEEMMSLITETGDLLRRALRKSVLAGKPPNGNALDEALLD